MADSTSLSKKLGAFLFESFNVALPVADVVSDIIIAWQFYENGEMVYFYWSVFIFLVAQVCYALYFMAQFRLPDQRFATNVLWFFLLVVVGQLLPLLVWVQHTFPMSTLIWAYDTCGFKPRSLAPSSYDRNSDGLLLYVDKMMVSHGGFLIEAGVESIPQSILQMVAYVRTGRISLASTISITVSVLSVASKGVVFSYCYHRPTFVFNSLGFTLDVFGLFTTISLVAYTLPGEDVYSVWPLPDSWKVSYLSSLWVVKELILLALVTAIGVSTAVAICAREVSSRNPYAGFLGLMYFWLMLCLVGPVILLLEGACFCILPLITVDAFMAPSRGTPFIRAVTSWLLSGDMENKLRVTLHKLAVQSAQVAVRVTPDPVQTYCMQATKEDFSLAKLRAAARMSLRDVFRMYVSADGQPGGNRISDILFAYIYRFVMFVLIPYLAVSRVCSVLFIAATMVWRGWGALGLLQRSLLLVCGVVSGVMAVLAPSVYQFYKVYIHLFTFVGTPRSLGAFENLMEDYVKEAVEEEPIPPPPIADNSKKND